MNAITLLIIGFGIAGIYFLAAECYRRGEVKGWETKARLPCLTRCPFTNK